VFSLLEQRRIRSRIVAVTVWVRQRTKRCKRNRGTRVVGVVLDLIDHERRQRRRRNRGIHGWRIHDNVWGVWRCWAFVITASGNDRKQSDAGSA
jgi:hypothetical protein